MDVINKEAITEVYRMELVTGIRLLAREISLRGVTIGEERALRDIIEALNTFEVSYNG